jgi:hypothetical protein
MRAHVHIMNITSASCPHDAHGAPRRGRGRTPLRNDAGGGAGPSTADLKIILAFRYDWSYTLLAMGTIVFTNDLRIKFLDVYRKCGLLAKSAAAIGISPDTVRKARKDDPDFEAAVKLAYDEFRESLEEEAYRRAVVGWDEDVFQKGECVGTRHVCSDRILELMLKRHIVEYRDRQSLDVNVAGGVLVVPGTKEDVDAWERRNRDKSAPDAAAS